MELTLTDESRMETPDPKVTGKASTGHPGSYDYDLVIVGTGGAGMAAAIRASELGATVGIIEEREVVGGTCVNIGCIPSKFLIEAAHHYHAARTGFPGITPSDPGLAWADVVHRKRQIVDRLRKEKYLDVLRAYTGVTLLRGRAELLGQGRIRIADAEIRAGKIVLATGTRPALPPIPGIEEAGVLDSTSAMELQSLPESMIVIGAGAIGLELGQMFHRFGVRVVIVEVRDQILPGEDPELCRVLAEALRAEGLEIHTGAKITQIQRGKRGCSVHVEAGTLEGELRSEHILVATGRAPNTRSIGLEAAGVLTDSSGFIRVDEYMRSANRDVFAAGDVTGGPGLVYVAALQGQVAAQTAVADLTGGRPSPIDLTTVPRVTFTDPQLAVVGTSENEAKKAGRLVEVTTLPIEILPRAVVTVRSAGLIRLVSEAGTGRLLGAHIVSANAGDMISEAALAIRFGMTVEDLASTLHPYLTWGEGLKLAAQTFTKDVSKLSCCA